MLRLEPHRFIDRVTGQECEEKVYGERALALLYGPLRWAEPFIARCSWLSRLYGWLQRRPRSRRKVQPFIEAFALDASEFERTDFASFDDFFVRRLKPEARPVGEAVAVIPADGRYWVCPEVRSCEHFYVKGQRLSVAELVGEDRGGVLVLGRLCPTDCHRFAFPCDGRVVETVLIEGPLASVNPVSLKRRLGVLATNKRFVTRIDSPLLGEVLMVEIGATHVGSIHQTYGSDRPVRKGEEKGFFSFGGSAIALLFERLALCEDLLRNSEQFLETRCLMGQDLARSVHD